MLGYAFRVGPSLELPARRTNLAMLIARADMALDKAASKKVKQMLTAPRGQQFHPVESHWVTFAKVNGTTVGDPGLLEDYSGLT